MKSRPRTNLPSLYLITDRKLASPDLIAALEAALKAGVRMIQLREKDLPLTELTTLAKVVQKLTLSYGAKLLLNGAPDLALQIDADGLQLGENTSSVAQARQLLGSRKLIGYSAHSLQDIKKAASQGADFVTFSPVYHTASKAHYGPPQGLLALRNICNETSLPVYALGGINLDHIDEVIHAGACGVAMISAILGQQDVQTSAVNILQKISSAEAELRECT